MSTTPSLDVATTILEQLGGRRFVAMTGARDLLGDATSLQFKIGAGAKDGCNAVRITLDATDTYTVRFYRVAKRGLEVTELGEVSMVYGGAGAHPDRAACPCSFRST